MQTRCPQQPGRGFPNPKRAAIRAQRSQQRRISATKDFSLSSCCLQDRSAFWPDGCGSDNCARPRSPPRPPHWTRQNRDRPGVELVAREDSRRIVPGASDRPGAPASAQSPDVRWVTSSTAHRTSGSGRSAELPRSSATAWEAAVTHPRHQPPPIDDHGAAADAKDGSGDGVEANARLTGMTALALLVLLAAEGYTVVRVGAHLTLHVVIGMILVPPVLLKIGSTSWRFPRYTSGHRRTDAKGRRPCCFDFSDRSSSC